MMGSDAAFGGRKNYFTSHGDYEIDDYYWAISEGLIPEGYYQWWGYEDAKLFEYAKDKLTEISKNDEPFNFSMLTVATHFEDGYKCDECDEKQYGDDHYGMVIDCSSSRVSEFIDWIKEQPFYENTTIILSGDHLTMDSDFCENIDEDYQRSTYNAILNSPILPVHEKIGFSPRWICSQLLSQALELSLTVTVLDLVRIFFRQAYTCRRTWLR